jgi:hypothetical protein
MVSSESVWVGRAEQRDRTMHRIAGRTLHHVRDTREQLSIAAARQPKPTPLSLFEIVIDVNE